MIPNTFTHAIGRVDFLGGVVRIELVTLVPTDAGTPVVEPHHAIIMPVEGLVDAARTLQGMVNKLAEAGVIRARPADPPSAARSAEKPAAPAVRSPNFG